MDNKGQLNILDLTIASVVIIMLLFSIMEAWNTEIESIHEFRKISKSEEKLSTITKQLIDTQGSPSDWHLEPQISFADHIGLNGYGSYLTREKLDKLSAENYEDFKDLLSVRGYDLYIKITDITNISQPVIYEMGNDTQNSNLKTTRLALLEDNIIQIEIKLIGDVR